MKKLALLFSSLITLHACTWVELDQQGAQVSITKQEHIIDCKKAGNVNVTSKHQLIGIERNRAKVLRELETLARNEAAQLGADTIVANNEQGDGQQSYAAYQCGK